MKRFIFITFVFSMFFTLIFSQSDVAKYEKYKLLKREIKEVKERNAIERKFPFMKVKKFKLPDKKVLTLDFSKIEHPSKVEEFKSVFHFPPIRQWWAGTCWCYSTISFLESEIYRLHHKKIKLSEQYIVYYEYVEKCRRFFERKGDSYVDQGSESNAVINRMKKYGLVRESDYTGLVPPFKVIDHTPMFKELKSYLEYVKKNNFWDVDRNIEYVKSILNKYMGKPPSEIVVDGKKMTPLEFMKNVAGLNPDDYVDFVSTLKEPFYKQIEFKVPDNWWHDKSYYNIPLSDFYSAILNSIKNGYSVAIGGDVSEPGYNGFLDIAIVPDFDIPYQYINQSSREFRIYNKTTTDDHGVHLVGYTHYKGHDWFLIKDSSRTGQRGIPGYLFYRDDYVKLKMLSFMVHKDAVKSLLEKIKKENSKNK